MSLCQETCEDQREFKKMHFKQQVETIPIPIYYLYIILWKIYLFNLHILTNYKNFVTLLYMFDFLIINKLYTIYSYNSRKAKNI